MLRLGTVVLAITVSAAGLCSPVAHALTGREILDKAKELDDTTRHWTDRTDKMTLHIYGKRGGKRRRDLEVFDKRYPGDEDKSILFFLSPPEVKGTGFLQWAHKGRDDDQWLYLPELKRTRRITARVRDQSFMGTDFSYRDLEILREIQDWTEEEAPAKLIGEEQVDGHAWLVNDAQEVATANRALVKKYGWQMRLANLGSHLTGKYNKRQLIGFKLGSEEG